MAIPGQHVRAATEADWPALLNVINADRLPGQPLATPRMLTEAAGGRSPIDSGFWDVLSEIEIDVLLDDDHVLRGAVSYATRPRDQAGLILWLHGREEPLVVTALLEHALGRLTHCSIVEAFSFATALGLGLEALPIRHRSVTDHALGTAGFASENLWRYMRRILPATDLPTADNVQVGMPEPGTRQLTITENNQAVAEATIGLPATDTGDIGVLWWINVEPAVRGRGLGRALLGSALRLLSEFGAIEVILYVDDDDPDPSSDRNRIAANRLYDATGFTEIDRLHSYKLAR